jgi:hypothetical protein
MNVLVPQIPAGQQATIELRTRVRNLLSAQQGLQVSNTVSYTYATSPGGTAKVPLISAPATFTIVEPTLGVTETGDKTTAGGGDVVRYNRDPDGGRGCECVGRLRPASGRYPCGRPPVRRQPDRYRYRQQHWCAGDHGHRCRRHPYVLSWSTTAGNADINVAKGTSVQISYDVRVANNIAALTSLANNVVVDWTGLDGSNTFERHGAGCPNWTAPNDYCIGPASYAVLTDPPRLDFTKTVVSTTPRIRATWCGTACN